MKSASKSPGSVITNGSRAESFRWLLASLTLLAVAGCGVYTFTGGGGFPSHIKSIAILPFDNQTTQFTLTQELTQKLSDDVPGRLGLKPADQSTADAVMRGSITGYADRAVNYQPDPGGPAIFQRRVDIAVAIEIYDVRQGQILWESRSLSAAGEYLPDSQSELEGRQLAIENLVQAIIDGAQSQW